MIPETTLTTSPTYQTPLVPYVVQRLPQGVLIRTTYPDSSTVTHHVLTYPHVGSLFAHVPHRANIKDYDLTITTGYRSALKSAWSVLRRKWMESGEIVEASQDSQLSQLIASKS